MQNYYQILGVSVSATEAEIKSAFKKLALVYHPDRNLGSKFHEEHYKTITEAYENLVDSEKRTIYDLKLVFGMMDESRPTGPRPAPSTAPPPHVYRGAQSGRPQYRKRETQTEPAADIKGEGFSSFQKVGNVVLVVAALIMLGLWLYSLRSRYSAEQALLKGNLELALSYDSTNFKVLYDLARRKVNQNKPDEALTYLNKAIYHSPNPMPGLHYARGNLFLAKEKHKEAYNDFIIVSQIEPNADRIWQILGDIALLHLKDYDKANEYFSKGITADPNSYECYLGKGVAAYNSGKYELGIESFNQASNISMNHPEIYYFRAHCKAETKDTEGACADFRLALDLGYMKAQEGIDSLCTPTY